MKDGTTHLAHKAEHAVDMDTGAILGVTLQDANLGDTTTVMETINVATENLAAVADDPRTADTIHPAFMSEAVLDKGYHSNETLLDLDAMMSVSLVESEPNNSRATADGPERRLLDEITVHSALSAVGDRDWFSITYPAMPRIARVALGNVLYHVMNRGNVRRMIFHKYADARAFVDLLGETKRLVPVRVLGY